MTENTMTENKMLTFYGLKFNPFRPNIPLPSLWSHPDNDLFLSRIRHLLPVGGFALISGAPGLGKSKLLHWLAGQLELLNDVAVGVMERPQSSLGDFYRELGDLFGVSLRPAHRYGGFKALRKRWREHLNTTLYRPVLLIDEGQEVSPLCLNELRILGSDQFDSECLLTTILSGDLRLPERFRTPELIAFGSRIRVRKNLESYTPSELMDFLEHLLAQAGAPHLMSEQLKEVLCESTGGNLRLLANTGADLLELGAMREVDILDEKLFLEYSCQNSPPRVKKKKGSKVTRTHG